LTNQFYSQILTEKTELKSQLSQLSYFPNNPCEIQNEVKLNCKNKVAHFLRFESCQEDNTKLKGIIYGVLVIDDTTFNVSLETANIFFNHSEDFLKDYKKLDKTKKTILENTNRQLNLDHYSKIREEIRKAEEKKRLEEEEKIRIEQEKKRLEEERLEKIHAEELANGLMKASNDSLVNDELNSMVNQYIQLNKSQDSLIEAKVKTGINLGGVLITQFSFTVSEYGVVDLTLGIQNVGKKRIKYATFLLKPYNSVDDPVEYEKSFKGIGFIEPNSEGVWDFDNAWYSDVIETLKLKNITLVYEDGTSKLVSKIAEIRIDDDEELVESIIDRERKVLHKIGSVILIEYQEKIAPMVGFCIYSISDKKIRAEVYSDEEAKLLIKNLKDVLSYRENNLIGKVGDFEVKKYSTLIYLYVEEGYCVININDAKKLLTKLEQLFPS
jgi:hypothetical protein